MLYALLLFAAAPVVPSQPQDFDETQCPAETRRAAPVQEPGKLVGRLLEPSGQGLWIGGVHFPTTDIASAAVGEDSAGRVVINVHFSPAGRHRFRCIQWGRVEKTIEISFNGRALSRPKLINHIWGDHFQISGVKGQREAEALVAKLTPR